MFRHSIKMLSFVGTRSITSLSSGNTPMPILPTDKTNEILKRIEQDQQKLLSEIGSINKKLTPVESKDDTKWFYITLCVISVSLVLPDIAKNLNSK
jgi:hypothetical protein